MTISDIEGIGEGYATKLKEIGITRVETLLEKAGSAAGRAELESKTGISNKLILRWVNHADLYRIQGVGAQMAELLEAAGVDSVAELAQRNAGNLAAKLDEVNTARNIVNRVPNEGTLSDWISAARSLPKMVTH